MSRRRQDAGFQRRAMVQPCPRCGALAPLLGREMFAKYRDGVCARCLAENLDTLMKGFREMGAVVGRFLNERGVTKPNEVLPRGEALYQALQKAAGLQDAEYRFEISPHHDGRCCGCQFLFRADFGVTCALNLDKEVDVRGLVPGPKCHPGRYEAKLAGPIQGCDGPAAGPIQPPAHPPGPCPDCRGHEGCCGDA